MRMFSVRSLLSAAMFAATFLISGALSAQSTEVTFHKDIEPILQRSCMSCHREGGAGPMPLMTYEQVAPFAGLIEPRLASVIALEPCLHGIWKKISVFKNTKMIPP